MRPRTWMSALLVLWLTVSAALAVRVEIEPKNPALYVGQAFTLQYRLIDASRPAQAPELAVDGCAIRYMGMSQKSFTHIVNGVRRDQEEYVYSYNVRAEKAGRFIAPALEFRVPGGEIVRAEPVAIVAADAPRSPDFQLDIRVDSDEVYVGQPVKITWEWRATRDFEGIELAWEEPENADVTVASSSDPARIGRRNVVAMMGVEAAINGSRRTIDGRETGVYSAELIVVPRRAGELVIPGSNVLARVDTGRRRRGLSVFESSRVLEWFSSEAPSQTLRVRELPGDGRPPGFAGLVGRYRVEATATPRNVRVGDPINLRVSVYGPETATREPELDLNSSPGFEGAFRVDQTGENAERQRGRFVYSRTLRAQRDDVDAIPSIEIPYFDPELGRYATARTSPISLEVTPTRVVTLADAQGGGAGGVEGSQLESRSGGLRANVTHPRALASERFDPFAIARSPLGVAGVLAPPAIFALAGVVVLARTRRERTSASRSARRALPEAMRLLSAASTTDDVAQTVRGYLATRFPEGGAAMTPDEVTRLLGDHSGTIEVASVLRACDDARFGGGEADAAELAQRAREALNALAKGERP